MNCKSSLQINISIFIILLSSVSFCITHNTDDSLTAKPINNNSTYYSKPIFMNNGENDAGSGGDAGDSIPFATNITIGQFNGTLSFSDFDYYSFSILKGNIINVSMIPANLSMNYDLSLYSPEPLFLKQNLKEAGIKETIIWSASTSGSYSILIEPNTADQIGNYTFFVEIISQNDFNTNTDAGNFLNDPLRISGGAANGTLVQESDEWDFYSLEIFKGNVINIFLQITSTSNIDLYFYDTNSSELINSKKAIGFNESILYSISIFGDYKIALQLVDVIDSNKIIPYNLSISINSQNDANSGTDAGGSPEEAFTIVPLRNSTFQGKLIYNGDRRDFYKFKASSPSIIYISLIIPQTINMDLTIYDSERRELYSSKNTLYGANEYILGKDLENGTYYVVVEYIDGDAIQGNYILNVGLFANPTTLNRQLMNVAAILGGIIGSLIVITLIIFLLYLFTDIKIPWITGKFDKYLYFKKEGKGETIKSLKYALKVRDDTITAIREDLINKDTKRAKDLETIHRLEDIQKSNNLVIGKLREESLDYKTRLDNLQAINDDLANIIDSTIRRQLAKTSTLAQKAKVNTVTALLWLSEERLVNYIESIPLLNERYILDRTKNYILTKDYGREVVRQAYWKRVGAMHLKKIKQVKVISLSEDTDIDIKTIKIILKELVERKEIPAPIHMDRVSLLLSIPEDLISELVDVAQNTPIISLSEISKSYDTTVESAKIIFDKVTEDGYVKGEFLNEDKFIVLDLFTNFIKTEGSVDISKIIVDYNLHGMEDDIKIQIEKLLQEGKLLGFFMTEKIFLCFNNLSGQLKNMIQTSIEDINKGDTRRVVFDIGSVVESIVKEKLILDIQECDNPAQLPIYHEVIESKELGKILRSAEEEKISLPANVELKSLNRFWAQKIKHTKPGELPFIPTIDEARSFLFEANRALNKLLAQKIPPKWKKAITENMLKEK